MDILHLSLPVSYITNHPNAGCKYFWHNFIFFKDERRLEQMNCEWQEERRDFTGRLRMLAKKNVMHDTHITLCT